MTRHAFTVMALAVLAAPAAAQTRASEMEWRVAAEAGAQAAAATRFSLEARVTPGKPYSAEAVTEFVQALGDGNRIVRRSTTRLFRDSEGRTRREIVSEGADVTQVVISDPIAGTSLILDPANRIARRAPAVFARGGTATATLVGPRGTITMGTTERAPEKTGTVTVERSGPTTFEWSSSSAGGENAAAGTRVMVSEPIASLGGGNVGFTVVARNSTAAPVKEDLGEQTIEGVLATGTRTTTTIPAGAIGNEQPIVVVSEQWFSSELEVQVLTKHTDPRVGETTYRLTNISRSEPDKALFAVPADYTVAEPAAVMRRQPQP